MQEQESQIYGIRALIEALKAGKTIDKVFLQKGLQGPLRSSTALPRKTTKG